MFHVKHFIPKDSYTPNATATNFARAPTDLRARYMALVTVKAPLAAKQSQVQPHYLRAQRGRLSRRNSGVKHT